MALSREERLAQNEAMFRIANERRNAWEDREPAEPELYFCECADPSCRSKVRLTGAEYESVRSESRRFFVLSGHELPDIETVIEAHKDWSIIEKNPEVTETVESLDPRREP